MFVVCVTFHLKADALAAFLPLMRAQAETSMTKEPGCHRFDICDAGDATDQVFLYEIYENAEAFDAHLASDHFKSFDAAVAPLVRQKTLQTYRRLHVAGAKGAGCTGP